MHVLSTAVLLLHGGLTANWNWLDSPNGTDREELARTQVIKVIEWWSSTVGQKVSMLPAYRVKANDISMKRVFTTNIWSTPCNHLSPLHSPHPPELSYGSHPASQRQGRLLGQITAGWGTVGWICVKGFRTPTIKPAEPGSRPSIVQRFPDTNAYFWTKQNNL